jgi:hypothetical protein
MRIMAALVLALSLTSVQAQNPGAKSLSQIELNAWSAYCTSQLDGNASLCSCVLEKQIQQNDSSLVSGALLQMVGDDPDATDSDNKAAGNKLELMYSGDPDGAADAKQAFNATLDDNVNACTPKGD